MIDALSQLAAIAAEGGQGAWYRVGGQSKLDIVKRANVVIGTTSIEKGDAFTCGRCCEVDSELLPLEGACRGGVIETCLGSTSDADVDGAWE